MKYVIPCAGIGSRLKPLTDTMPKELILINNIPVIYFAINLIKKADKNPFICIIISSSKIS
ncbi:MAG: UTP--glucose-1-phosphate uridylyltransferase, partial [Mycoplasmataceae bacterium]|nr:UTP--glucose-1-phosphate uridylyltransferase [Mycoplasmataceae bacterium]